MTGRPCSICPSYIAEALISSIDPPVYFSTDLPFHLMLQHRITSYWG
jgi:hypothetical protein